MSSSRLTGYVIVMNAQVLHGANSDIVWLQRDFGLYVVGLFDTYHATHVLGASSAKSFILGEILIASSCARRLPSTFSSEFIRPVHRFRTRQAIPTRRLANPTSPPRDAPLRSFRHSLPPLNLRPPPTRLATKTPLLSSSRPILPFPRSGSLSTFDLGLSNNLLDPSLRS